jgi:hypothetical protein
MESELDLLLGTAVDSLLKLGILLHLYGAPAGPTSQQGLRSDPAAGPVPGVASASEIALQLQRPEDQTAQALEELSQVGLVARFALGTGRHVLYGLPDDSHVQELLALLHDRYHRDQDSRTQLVRQMIRQSDDSETQNL